ncbi:MAG: heparan-alpha-glucosaminide N-acetyltransferase domain-containing protein [Planctomycetota bacterium]
MNAPAVNQASKRIVSLDAFRGLTIMLMILVNNPGDWGSMYWPLKHAEWHGWTPTDLVFPFFLFIVGVAIPLSLGKRKAGGDFGPVIRHIVWRSLALFGIGVFLSAFGLFFKLGPEYGLLDLLHSVRIPGVLQRIAVCYLVVSLLFLLTKRSTLVVVTLFCLLIYWALMTLVPVPEYGAGKIDGKDTHLAAYVDRVVFGSNHLWSAARTWDPEGLLSTLPALATTLFGVFTGMWLKRDQPLTQRLIGLLLAGGVLVAIGWAWGTVFPINKPIWTSSYAVFTAGLALLVFGLCVLVFDVLPWQRLATPLQIYGVNALTVFVMSSLVGQLLVKIKVGANPPIALKTWLYDHLFLSWLTGKNASLAYSVAWVLCWFVVLTIMYRKHWITKV